MAQEEKERRYRKKKFSSGEFMETISENSPIYDEEILDGILRSIAINIKIAMEKKELSICTLQELSGVDGAHLSRIFNHRANIGMKAFIKIAYALHVQPGELIPIVFNDSKRLTNGEKFENITKQLDMGSCNFLLSFCANYADEYRRIRHLN